MSDANAIEEDYVETSDAEELEVLYPVVVEELLSSSPIITPKRGPQEDGSDRKRRKVSFSLFQCLGFDIHIHLAQSSYL